MYSNFEIHHFSPKSISFPGKLDYFVTAQVIDADTGTYLGENALFRADIVNSVLANKQNGTPLPTWFNSRFVGDFYNAKTPYPVNRLYNWEDYKLKRCTIEDVYHKFYTYSDGVSQIYDEIPILIIFFYDEWSRAWAQVENEETLVNRMLSYCYIKV